MDKVIIFGVNMFSAVVLQSILKEKKAEVLCFTLNGEFIKFDSFEGYPVIPFEELDSKFDMRDVKIAITIGYSNMNKNRAEVYSKCKDKGYNIYSFISDDAYVMSDRIGEGSIILPQSFIGPYVTIGKCVIIWPVCQVGHHIRIGDFTHIAGGTVIGGGTDIGSYCFLGMSCIVNNGISIGDKSFIGAGSFINKSIVEGSVYIGNPAKKIDFPSEFMTNKVK